jgi:hypothetical protein
MIAFKSKYFIQPLPTIVGSVVLLIFQIFLISYIPIGVREYIEILFAFLYVCLYFSFTFYLFLTTHSRLEIVRYIDNLETEKESKRDGLFAFRDEEKLNEYYEIREELLTSSEYAHCFRTKKEIIDLFPSYYMLIVAMLFCGQNCFSLIQPTGSIVYFILIFLTIILCILLPYWELFKLKNFQWSLVIYLGGCYILLALAKSFYTDNYGSDVLGSYFEKNEYRTKYYVKMIPEEGGRSPQKVIAEIYVHTESNEDELGEDRFGQEHSRIYDSKFIELERVYLNGGQVLTFDHCALELSDEVLCRDETGANWYIELTTEKVQ